MAHPNDPYAQPHYNPYNPVPPPIAPSAYEIPSLAHTPMPLVDTTRARNAAIALVGCGVLLLVGMISHAWFSARGDANVGLIGIEECRRFACRTMQWLDVPRAPSELKLFASLGLIGGLAALGFLVQAAVVLFKNQPHRVLMKWLNATLGVAAFGCFSFFFHLVFGEMSKKLDVSYAGFFAMGGIIAASIVAVSMVRPLMRTTNR